ncbi:OprO/OprP family phosphate-selective porin [Pontibacter sp. E15-1]|uniref:OprO/OprP family phosphate-selective porin n=1 Tax=Pontibacter sp. E15-1 TaxID=2919918 RepID=UPI001F50403C|nr:OprO/OprP family phosphate-selective porin [Pontibacter sp. E15-1]MCJ8163383.1 OprO/OprP family phosphate-selective porin [Pontibacter sp. E15-1]
MKTAQIVSVCIGILFIPSLAFGQANQTQSQMNENRLKESGETKFLLSGYGFTGFEKKGDESTFGPLGFSPIFLWKKTDRLFFEAELEAEIEDGEFDIGLEYASIYYRLNDFLIVGAGKFLTPFGIFSERLHPAWINKMAEKPLGFSSETGMVGPMTSLGAQARGGAPLGNTKINYSFYIANGPGLLTDGDEAGKLDFNNLGDNNLNKALGGRIGFLPFSNSSLEIGASGQFAKVGDRESPYKKIGAAMYAGDLSYIWHAKSIKSVLDLKGQYNYLHVERTDYSDLRGNSYSFDNNSSAYFLQVSLRPVNVDSDILKNVELTGRYSRLKTPEGSEWHRKQKQTTLGINYWLSWSSVVKVNYAIEDIEGSDSENGFFIQFALGF